MTPLRLFPALAAAAALALPVAANAQVTPGTPDVVTSPNVEHIGAFKLAGDGTGARVIGDILYTTSSLGLFIFDIKDPETPKLLGSVNVAVHFENEDVPTNGKILGISDSTVGQACGPTEIAGGCLMLYDVSNPAAPTLIKQVTGFDEHTAECVFDCTWFYGSEGAIIDARDPKNATVVEANWVDRRPGPGLRRRGGLREPARRHRGRPRLRRHRLAAVRAVLAAPRARRLAGESDRDRLGLQRRPALRPLGHVAQPGPDRFMLVGGESVLGPVGNGGGPCNDEIAAFMTWDANPVKNPAGGYNLGSTWSLIDEIRPFNGNYVDGGHPVDAFGCSVHWFDEHPTFRNGGLVAVVRVRARHAAVSGHVPTARSPSRASRCRSPAPRPRRTGRATARSSTRWTTSAGWTSGATRATRTSPDDDGSLTPKPGATPGTSGERRSDVPPCASAAGFRSATAKGSGSGVKIGVKRREQRPFNVDVFQQSQGRKVISERLVARFAGKTKSFTWNGKDRKRRSLKDGNYFVRFTMKLASGAKDVRRATLTRSRGRFRPAPAYFQRLDCGIFKSLKLTSSVFGGSANKSLGIAYKLDQEARAVKITVKVGSKTISRFTGKGTVGRTFRFSLPSKKVKRGKTVKVLVQADRGGSTPTVVLTAKRI